MQDEKLICCASQCRTHRPEEKWLGTLGEASNEYFKALLGSPTFWFGDYVGASSAVCCAEL